MGIRDREWELALGVWMGMGMMWEETWELHRKWEWEGMGTWNPFPHTSTLKRPEKLNS